MATAAYTIQSVKRQPPFSGDRGARQGGCLLPQVQKFTVPHCCLTSSCSGYHYRLVLISDEPRCYGDRVTGGRHYPVRQLRRARVSARSTTMPEPWRRSPTTSSCTARSTTVPEPWRRSRANDLFLHNLLDDYAGAVEETANDLFLHNLLDDRSEPWRRPPATTSSTPPNPCLRLRAQENWEAKFSNCD